MIGGGIKKVSSALTKALSAYNGRPISSMINVDIFSKHESHRMKVFYFSLFILILITPKLVFASSLFMFDTISNTIINITIGLIMFILIRKRTSLPTIMLLALLVILGSLLTYVLTVRSVSVIIPIYLLATRSVPVLLILIGADVFYNKFEAAASKKKLAYQYLLNIIFVLLLAVGFVVVHEAWWWFNEGR